MELGTVGIWSISFRGKEPSAIADAAAELEDLGYPALWVPGARGGALFDDLTAALGATSRLVLATGIVNIWMHDAQEVCQRSAALEQSSGHRLVLGLGISHARMVETLTDRSYTRPLAVMREYLDRLDAGSPPLPVGDRLLAALGPRMLELARTRAAGAHPYLTTPEHTAGARVALGPGAVLAPELMVVLATDPAVARARARRDLAGYLTLPNYTNNLLRIGFTEADIADGGSDALVDALVAWGDVDAIAVRIGEHLDAGADHVCLQVLSEERNAFAWEEWRALAPLAASFAARSG
jgi:probable F420-dependent oxidoreductase